MAIDLGGIEPTTDRIWAVLSRQREFKLGGDRQMIDPCGHAERCKPDIAPSPPAIDDRLGRKPRTAILPGDETDAGLGSLPVLHPEHESQRHSRKRLVFPVREPELDIKANRAALGSAGEDKRRGGETGQSATQDDFYHFGAPIYLQIVDVSKRFPASFHTTKTEPGLLAIAHSAMILFARIPSPQRWSSSLMKAAFSAGVRPSGSTLSARKRCCTSGILSTSMVALAIRSCSSGLRLGGPTIAYQTPESRPGRATSALVGTSGIAALRAVSNTARTLSLPS